MKCQNKECKTEATCQISDMHLCPNCFGVILLAKLKALGGEIPYHNTFKAREERRQLMIENSEEGIAP